MVEEFAFALLMIFVMVLLIMLANRLRIAYPVLLVLAGLLISIIPGFPVLRIDPELIFVIFLPPLLYEAAWAISWRELWRWRRVVTSFAFVVVFLTAFSVAIFANAIIPGFTLAMGFLLGGIVSPPDAVSANTILRFVKVPKRMSSILEGESLMNDASSLIIFRFAMLAIATGQFIWYDAALSFGWMVLGGVGIGLLLGWLFMQVHRRLPTDANIDIILTIITPYFMYIAAEELHSSGVMAVVSGGLLLSNKRHQFLGSTSRLRGVNVWESFVFLLNGIVFLLIGLDLPEIKDGLEAEGVSFSSAIGYGLLVTAVLVVVRFISAFGAVVVTMIMRNFITVADPNPGFKAPLLLGWTGMRGVVSLAAALSIPVHFDDGTLFPQRNLILFITFIVILTTLVVQGLTLPVLIRKIKLPAYDDYMDEHEADAFVKRELAREALDHLSGNYADDISRHPQLVQLMAKWRGKTNDEQDAFLSAEGRKIYLDVLDRQRQWLLSHQHAGSRIEEDVLRNHLKRIDMEEEKLGLM